MRRQICVTEGSCAWSPAEVAALGIPDASTLPGELERLGYRVTKVWGAVDEASLTAEDVRWLRDSVSEAEDPDLALACDRVLGLDVLDDCDARDLEGIVDTSRVTVVDAINKLRAAILHVEVEWEPIDSETLTGDHLLALFAAHCECRPINLRRAEDEHSHDCDLAVLDDVQSALLEPAGGGVLRRTRALECRRRCAGHLNEDMASDIYRPRVLTARRSTALGERCSGARTTYDAEVGVQVCSEARGCGRPGCLFDLAPPLVIHVLSQQGQPYGSERRACNHCGAMIWGPSAPAHVDNWEDWRASPSNCGRETRR